MQHALRRPAAPTAEGARAWIVRHAAVAALLGWVVSPEIRRYLDFTSAFHPISVLSVLPMVVLLPGFYLLRSTLDRLGATVKQTLLLWAAGFAYAYVVSLMYGSYLAGVFSAALYFMPIAFVVYFVRSEATFFAGYEHFLDALFWTTAAAAVYGIYQYVAPPAWDAYWLESTGITSMGNAEPFGLRVWGTLGSTGTFAQFMTFTIISYLPRLRLSRWPQCVALVLMIMALLFTFVRTCWIELAIGLLVYTLATPRRGSALTLIASVGIAAPLALGAFVAWQGAQGQGASDNITTRFSTLGDLDNDDSYLARQQVFAQAVASVVREPLGQGLGTVGTGAKLGSKGETVDFDNGYLARIYEMGFIGAAPFFASLALVAVRSLQALRLRGVSPEMRSYVAAAVAIQAIYLFGQVAADSYNGLPGMYFWMQVTVVSVLLAQQSPRNREAAADAPTAPAGA